MDLQRSSSDADLLQHRSVIDGSVLYVRVLVAGEHLHAFEWSVDGSDWLSTHQDCSVLPQDQQVRIISWIACPSRASRRRKKKRSLLIASRAGCCNAQQCAQRCVSVHCSTVSRS